MRPLIRRAMREPLWIIGPLWPFALLTPYLPGLPRPAMGGLPWRQEIIVALLLSATFALLLKRAWASAKVSLEADRTELFLAAPGLPVRSVERGFVFGRLIPTLRSWSVPVEPYLLFFVLMRRVAARPEYCAHRWWRLARFSGCSASPARFSFWQDETGPARPGSSSTAGLAGSASRWPSRSPFSRRWRSPCDDHDGLCCAAQRR